MDNRIIQKKDITNIIRYIKNAETKKQVKQYLINEYDRKDFPYIFYCIFSRQDEELLQKLPREMLGSAECHMLYYFFGEQGEKYYPADKKSQAKFYRGDKLHIVNESPEYDSYYGLYRCNHYIYDGDYRSGYIFSEYFLSVKDWITKDGETLKGKWLYDVEIPKKGIKDIDFTGAYVKKSDAARLAGSIPVERIIIQKWYEEEDDLFIVKYGYVDNNGNLVKEGEEEEFFDFKDFAKYLKNDLSGGIYTGYDFSKVKLDKYNLTNAQFENPIDKKNLLVSKTGLIDSVNGKSGTLVKNKKQLPAIPHEDDYSNYCIFYISDLHLDHKISKKCRNDYDVNNYLDKKISEMVHSTENSPVWFRYAPIVIVGDISLSFELNELFFRKLKDRVYKDVIVVLGNHDLWYDNYQNQIARYQKLFDELGIILLNNGLYTVSDLCLLEDNKKYYSEEYLINASVVTIREIVKKSRITFFGGIGFSGLNQEFNATKDIYRGSITREDEIAESKKFESLYLKIKEAIGDRKNVVVVTHMPPQDWTATDLCPNWIYMYGHNHRNYFQNNQDGVVLADNQIGYSNKKFLLNRFFFDGKYDIFADYSDGIYNITAEQYKDFAIGKDIIMQYTNTLPIVMVKKNGVYLFLRKSKRGYCILNGGKPVKVDKKPEYYYEHMDAQIKKIMTPLQRYTKYQNEYSKYIRSIGGRGTIHGCIIDINFYSHIYINPLDGKVTPYFALDIVNKIIYPDFKSLLEAHAPECLEKYITSEHSLPAVRSVTGSKKAIYQDTDIYEVSRILKSMQYLQNEAVIRRWFEDKDNSKEVVKELGLYLE